MFREGVGARVKRGRTPYRFVVAESPHPFEETFIRLVRAAERRGLHVQAVVDRGSERLLMVGGEAEPRPYRRLLLWQDDAAVFVGHLSPA